MNSRQDRYVTMSPWSWAAASLLIVLQTAGCSGLDKLRGDGLKESEDWGQELREQRNSGGSYGGLSTKANQIERNLGVR